MYIFCLVVLCLTFIDYKAERNSCKVGINYEFMWVLAESQQSFQRMLKNFQRFPAKVKNSNLTENVSIPLQTWHKIHKHQYKLGQLTILAPANHLNTNNEIPTKSNKLKLLNPWLEVISMGIRVLLEKKIKPVVEIAGIKSTLSYKTVKCQKSKVL